MLFLGSDPHCAIRHCMWVAWLKGVGLGQGACMLQGDCPAGPSFLRASSSAGNPASGVTGE